MAFVLNHLVWFLSVPTIAIIVALLVFVPGAWAAVFAFLRTTFGKVVTIVAVTAALSGFAGWELRAYVDGNIAKDVELRQALAVSGALIKQEKANRATMEAANQRARDAATRASDLQEQVDDYADELASRKPDDRCRLNDADVRRMRRILGADHPADRAR